MVADSVPRYYWDACAWIGLINQEPKKYGELKAVWEMATRGLCELWTSSYTYLEVFKAKAESGDPLSIEESDKRIDALLEQPYIKRVQMDAEIAKHARQLRRRFPTELTKRSDAIHVATATWWNLDELHTYDPSHLLALNERVERRDGRPIIIKIPNTLAGTIFDPSRSY